MLTTFRATPSSIRSLSKTLSETYSEECLLGDSKSSQVDSEEPPSQNGHVVDRQSEGLYFDHLVSEPTPITWWLLSSSRSIDLHRPLVCVANRRDGLTQLQPPPQCPDDAGHTD